MGRVATSFISWFRFGALTNKCGVKNPMPGMDGCETLIQLCLFGLYSGMLISRILSNTFYGEVFDCNKENARVFRKFISGCSPGYLCRQIKHILREGT